MSARLFFCGDTMQDIVHALRSGDPARAESLSRERLRARPGDENLLVLLALSLHHQGRNDEAVAVHRQLTQLFPDAGLHWANLAAALRQSGRVPEAISACEQGLRVAPDDPELLASLGGMRLRLREYESARDLLLRAHALKPQAADIAIQAAQAAIACRDYFAEDLIQGWRGWLPLADGAQFDLAFALMTIGDAAAAQELLEDLVARAPEHLHATALLASVYERSNRLQDARVLIERIKLQMPDPVGAVAHDIAHSEARLAERAGDFTGARALLDARGPRSPEDFDHYFALAQVCDKLDERTAALQALQTAHALQIEDMRRAAPQRFLPDAPMFPAANYTLSNEDYAAWPQLRAPDTAQSPIFIVGFPRSGTTLLEQMLDAHPALQSMDERPFFNVLGDRLSEAGLRVPRELARMQQSDCDQLREGYWELVRAKIARKPDTQLVDKNPLNMLWLPLIHRLFPYARYILALRDPRDVLLSNYFQNFRSVVLGAVCADVESLARGYVTAMTYWLHHVELFKPQVFVSRYETLVAEPELQAGRLAAFLGLMDAQPLLNSQARAQEKGYIATPSYTEVIQPITPRRVNRWQRYREALQPALPILEPMLRHWGYAID